MTTDTRPTLKQIVAEWRASHPTGYDIIESQAAMIRERDAEIKRLDNAYDSIDRSWSQLISDNATIREQLKAAEAERDHLTMESKRLRKCETCGLTGGEKCVGMRCDECYSELESDLVAARAELERLSAIIDESIPTAFQSLAHELDNAGILFNAIKSRTSPASPKAELDASRMTLGVGSGDGALFVHGDYDSIKACQAKLIERDELRAELDTARGLLSESYGVPVLTVRRKIEAFLSRTSPASTRQESPIHNYVETSSRVCEYGVKGCTVEHSTSPASPASPRPEPSARAGNAATLNTALPATVGEAVASSNDTGPCDIWSFQGAGDPGDEVYCRTHHVGFISPNPCPKGRHTLPIIGAVGTVGEATTSEDQAIIEWGEQKSVELIEGPHMLEGVQLAKLVEIAKRKAVASQPVLACEPMTGEQLHVHLHGSLSRWGSCGASEKSRFNSLAARIWPQPQPAPAVGQYWLLPDVPDRKWIARIAKIADAGIEVESIWEHGVVEHIFSSPDWQDSLSRGARMVWEGPQPSLSPSASVDDRPCLFCGKLMPSVVTDDWSTMQPHGGGEVQFLFAFGSTKFDDCPETTKFRALICDDCAEKSVSRMERLTPNIRGKNVAPQPVPDPREALRAKIVRKDQEDWLTTLKLGDTTIRVINDNPHDPANPDWFWRALRQDAGGLASTRDEAIRAAEDHLID